MSKESSDGDPLADWAFVSREGSVEGDEASSSSSSSSTSGDDFVNVKSGSVTYNRHRSPSVEANPLPENRGSSVKSDLLQDSLEEADLDEASRICELDETQIEATGIPSAQCLTTSSSSGHGPAQPEGAESSTDLGMMSQDLSPSSVSPIPEPGASAVCDDLDLGAVPQGLDSEVDQEEGLNVCLTVPNSCLEPENPGYHGITDKENNDIDDRPCDANEENAQEETIEPCGATWLKYPIERSSSDCQTIRLGDGRVIVVPPGADLETLTADLQPSNKSDTSSETGSESDFVRLDAASSCSSLNDNSDTEVEELGKEESPAPEDVPAPVEAMASSASSVSSRFCFLPRQNQQVPQPPPLVVRPESPADFDNGDGDTESMSGHSEDDRIESDQSEGHPEQEDEDQAFNDIGDLPLVAGDRQYTHHPNKRLNWTLDVVVIMVILLAIGIGIGHSIGSMREHYLNYEINQAQQSRLSLLQDDLLQCHQKTDELLQRNEVAIQAESDRRREVVDSLSDTNSELRGQLEALEKDLSSRQAALNYCQQVEDDLRSVSTDLRNENNLLRHKNLYLTDRIAALEYQATLMETKIKPDTVSEDMELLRAQVQALKVENDGLKKEFRRLESLLHPEDDVTEVEDAGDESDEFSAKVPSSSCSVQFDALNKAVDLKARINLLEQENADLRAEIGRLRYKSHPGNVHNEFEEFVENCPSQGDESRLSEEEIVQLQTNLTAARKEAESWQRLYLSLKNQTSNGTHPPTFLTCMKVLSQQINSSINTTFIKNYVNVSQLLLSVEDIKEAFVGEISGLWKDFSGSKAEEEQESAPNNPQKRWSESLKNILNKTQSSMTNMSEQIKATWNQVKNLSEELWKKHEPGLSKVATKISEKVRRFSDHVQSKIKQKARKWFKKNRGMRFDEDSYEENVMKESKRWHKKKRNERRKPQKSNKKEGQKQKSHRSKHGHDSEKKNNFQKRKDSDDAPKKWQKKGLPKKWHGKKHFHNMGNLEQHHSHWSHKHEAKNQEFRQWHYDRKQNNKQGEKRDNDEKLRKKSYKQFNMLKQMVKKLTEEDHLRMTKWDGQSVCDLFVRFQTDWDIYRWLRASDIRWTICQSAWWHDRLRDHVPTMNAECHGNIYGWQLEWAPSGDGKGKFRQGSGKKSTFDSRKKPENKTKISMELFDDERNDAVQEEKDWQSLRTSLRYEQRKEEHKADWLFDRAVDRREERDKNPYVSCDTFAESVHRPANEQPDPKAEWMFVRAEDREYHHSQPDSWYFKRMEARENNQNSAQDNPYQSKKEFDDDDFDEDDEEPRIIECL